MTAAKSPTDIKLVTEFFELKASQIMAEKKAANPLTKEDIAELGEGIRSGSMTY